MMSDDSHDVFDLVRFNEVTGGDREFATELVAVYLRDAADCVQALEDALVALDMETAVAKAHTLKGSSANIGAEALRGLAASMEKALLAESAGLANTLMPEIRAAFDRTRDAVQPFINHHPL